MSTNYGAGLGLLVVGRKSRSDHPRYNVISCRLSDRERDVVVRFVRKQRVSIADFILAAVQEKMERDHDQSRP